MNGKNPLKLAHDLEVKGLNFYVKLAMETKNKLVKELFYSLAKEEVDHARRIDALYNSKDILKLKEVSNVEKAIKEYFKKTPKKDLKSGKLNVPGYEFAMKFELKSVEMYQEMLGKSKTSAQKDFFKALVKEEQNHYDALANVYKYLTNTGDWLQEDESKTWNWMNI